MITKTLTSNAKWQQHIHPDRFILVVAIEKVFLFICKAHGKRYFVYFTWNCLIIICISILLFNHLHDIFCTDFHSIEWHEYICIAHRQTHRENCYIFYTSSCINLEIFVLLSRCLNRSKEPNKSKPNFLNFKFWIHEWTSAFMLLGCLFCCKIYKLRAFTPFYRDILQTSH